MRDFARLAVAAWAAGMIFLVLSVAGWFAEAWLMPVSGRPYLVPGQAAQMAAGFARAGIVLLPLALFPALVLRLAVWLTPLVLTVRKIAVLGGAVPLAGMLLLPHVAETLWAPWDYVLTTAALALIGAAAAWSGWRLAFGPGAELGRRRG
ncbi:hypothetical protein [Poseidonocella sp. HB161398]|uniref:hypothetical protein n=1 Tax=Poseidonocella sp. HB161398 TaxID=2320855 RepID=UPI0011094A0A|nr:hypothetical protein [Poseidonocella sp. HB161398]